MYLWQDLAEFPDIVDGMRRQLQERGGVHLVDVVILAALLKLIPRKPLGVGRG